MNSQEGDHHAGPLVLVVEDEQPIADTLADIVAEAGYQVAVARNGRQGLELARSQPPALVLTDMMMPFMDGAALIAALRHDAEENGTSVPPIILMSAAGRVRLDSVDADAVLHKPFNIVEVERLLERFLGTPG